MKTRFKITLLVICLAVNPVGCGFLAPATYPTVEYQEIHRAALDGDIDKLRGLLKTDPNLVNVGDYDKNTPLHLTAMHGHADASVFLLEHGASVNAQNSGKMTPLHLAVKQDFIDVVKVLLIYKPDLDIKDSRGWTPLNWAMHTKKIHSGEIANLLRENGAQLYRKRTTDTILANGTDLFLKPVLVG